MNVNESYVGRSIRLTMFSPEIIHRAIRGTLPEDIRISNDLFFISVWQNTDREKQRILHYFSVYFCKILISNILQK